MKCEVSELCLVSTVLCVVLLFVYGLMLCVGCGICGGGHGCMVGTW